MLTILAFAVATISNEQTLEIQNNEIFESLKNLSQSNYFSKIKMSFNDKCPNKMTKCSQITCAVPQIKFQGKDGYIDLLSVKESFSNKSSKSGPIVWNEMYKLSKDNDSVRKLLSGLHFSVSTHLSAFHTKLFNRFFSHPLLFKKRFKREYKENFLFLYNIVKLGVANLSSNQGEVSEEAKEFSLKLRRIITDEMEEKAKISLYQKSTNKKSLLEKDNNVDIEHLSESKISNANEIDEFLESLPKFDSSVIDILNQFPKHVACLECEKCKLWGTIQVKGLKGAIKSINGHHLYKNEVIFLINLLRQLSITMIESRRLENKKWPHLHLVIICKNQILSIIAISLLFTLLVKKIKRSQKQKLE
jgi:ERO1-like protein alpha